MAFEDKFLYHADRANNVLSWQVRDALTVEDAEKASALVKQNLAVMNEAKLLVDNRFMVSKGRPIVFSPEVNMIWEQLQSDILPKVSKCAILCSGVIMKMQMDRIARASGMIEVLQSFWSDDSDTMRIDAYQFLGVTGNELIDRHTVQA
ncbi:hypothetical protein N0M98_23115 [Paenibacillus doosanensis]|uniref:Uncharacterized protein n=1 Tax=Paenibacillus konkukensis TaxID=2020716 RepID=A0ABY4RKM9_9BACL|nr:MULTISPECIES: hypothetical protein [Paenibacillus]MCS7463022.1 hypothetical protein [Paenibacillus doosanensis]UQZ83052.1 hypothetical protein SK3146_02213 [Paenibacillus konkukensis]